MVFSSKFNKKEMVDFISVFGIFISLLLLIFLKPHNKSNIYLSGYFFSMGTLALLRNSILYLQNETILHIFLPGLLPIFITSSPFLYLYIRSSLHPSGFRPVKSWDYLHFLCENYEQLWKEHLDKLAAAGLDRDAPMAQAGHDHGHSCGSH